MKNLRVEKAAVDGLVEHLAEVERLGGITPRKVEGAIRRAVEVQWGTAKIPQFLDERGVTHWVIDLSDALDGEVYYALVTRQQGEPVVVSVMSEEQIEGRLRGRSRPSKEPPATRSHLDDMPTQAEMGIDPENPNGPTLAEQRDRALVEVDSLRREVERLQACQKEVGERGDEKVLLKWYVSSKEGPGKEERLTVVDVPAKIQTLLFEGVKPEHIEVWSQLRRPRVKVELELDGPPIQRRGAEVG